MKIVFVKSACGIGYGYMEGATLDCEEAFGMKMVNLGYAEIVTQSADGLPEDLPGKEAFLEAGITTIDDVKAIGDFTQIKGIGEATAVRITEYLKK